MSEKVVIKEAGEKTPQVSMFNGNGYRYKRDIPEIHILDEFINDVALDNIKKQTGITFKNIGWGYTGQPKTFYQITKLFLTYDWKTQYHDNNTTHNTIFLKTCRDEGFKVRTVCYDCCKDNRIHTGDLQKGEKLIV